ncbi:MAG: AAA family ATPase [Bacteroidales bacterium]|jgi:exodeoxyribonuclease-5|nr:AAA family ATPase [Bacteroidales bacterium]
MLKNHLKDILYHHLQFDPTEGQKKLMDSLTEIMTSTVNRQLMLVKGYAGTGKTSVISAFVRTLNDFKMRPVLMAPTGRAAKVLSAYSGEKAFTIHKKIYRQKSSADGFGDFALNFNTYSNTFFIVDEASMISRYSADRSFFGTGNLLDDLLKFVYNDRNCRLILIGDTAQLPPVGQEESPALDRRRLEAYGLEVFECELTEVVRQSQESGILHNATIVRELITEQQQGYPPLELGPFPDVKRISGEDLIETIADVYDKYGIDETAIICRSNKQANRYNQGIRNRILYREEELTPGDFLMVVRNNYHWIKDTENISFIANGDIVRVIRIRKYTERYGFRFAEVDICLPDYNDYEFTAIIMLDALCSEAASITGEQSQRLYNSVAADYAHITPKAQQYKKIKEDPYFNALQVKFAYAITCHKAQGGQWQCVFLDQGWLTDEMLNIEYLRWLYTAITRATEKLYLVNFSKKFFEN